MLLNRLKLYQPNNLSNSGAKVLDDPYEESLWDADTSHGASRNALRDKFESMGYMSGRMLYVDQIHGSDATGKRGNILKPFASPYAAMAYANPGDLIVMFPGTYYLYAFGLPLKDGVDYMLLKATFQSIGFCYGSILVYPSAVSCRIFGQGEFRNSSSNADWAQITPYVGCAISFEGITFTASKQFIGQQGLLGGDRFLSFKNCQIYASDNIIPKHVGAGNFINGSARFENCYFKGYMSVSNEGQHPQHDYKLHFRHCLLEAIDTNTNGYSSSLGLWDYNGNSDRAKTVLEYCTLVSSQNNLVAGEGYNGIGTNKLLVLKDCYCLNANGYGWLINEHPTLGFKLLNNWTRYPATGSVLAANLLSTSMGMSEDPLLE
ncbi:MAG: hypothetical protein MUF42_12205 [Cytophagaceae bacterium]|jgi:hypothetical protein|nr:hypothetical protein [Cytophagaceae bacterium]